MSESFEIKAEVNNDGDLCLLFIEKKNHFTSKEFYFKQKKESPGLLNEYNNNSLLNENNNNADANMEQ